ncbi:ABC transporter substrate-binding protein [Jeotgalibaca arthritidis]|uniref:ABC transporter substrate-binding protein n=1 Tax=Jeotgalibaca arthritidis TaxID=1868794 RepID=UPI0035A10F82
MKIFNSYVRPEAKITLDTHPSRIVTLGYDAYDTLRALGVENLVIAAPKHRIPEYISSMPDSVADTKSLTEIDLEQIRLLKPDLIIASARTLYLLDDLEKIAPVFNYDTYSSDYWSNFDAINLELARIVNKEAEAKHILLDLNSRADRIRAASKNSPSKTLLLLHNENSFTTFKPNSRFALFFTLLDFTPVERDYSFTELAESIKVSEIAALDADRVFIINRSAAMRYDPEQDAHEQQMLMQRDDLQTIRAFDTGHLFFLTPDLWYLSGGGLDSTGLQLEELSDLLDL